MPRTSPEVGPIPRGQAITYIMDDLMGDLRAHRINELTDVSDISGSGSLGSNAKAARSGGRWPEPRRTPSGVDRAVGALRAVGLALFADGMVMGLGILLGAVRA